MNQTNIINVNEIEFEKMVLEESTKRLIIVDFWAPWCGPCKQLTPILEKIISSSPDKVVLAKINIDENQQIASQLRIQSIPAIFAFKDKQVVNAFQGVIPEKEIIKFIEQSLGQKLSNNFDDFYNEIQNLLKEKSFGYAKEQLESFVAENSKDPIGIGLYLEALVGLNEITEADEFLASLNEELVKDTAISKVIKKIELIKKANKEPSIEELSEKLAEDPNNIDLIFRIADLYFAKNEFDLSFETLLEHYPKNKDRVKSKILSFFEVLGFEHESSILYRKKLSSIMFS
tara:strand:- start:23006 stop:23869 length:864 start_codon:yes stop_codon:yes gene_type:complete